MKKLNFDQSPFENNGEKPEVEFPVNYELKVILESGEKIDNHQRNLELVLEDADVNHNFVKSRHSRKGNFVSLTMHVTLDSMKQMQYLYRRLRLLPGIRFAV